jgi:hypothetical protein
MTDGDLTFGSFDCRQTDRSITLDLVEGFWEAPQVRGIDVILVGKTGRYVPPIARVADKRVIRLSGWVLGLGDTQQDRWESLDETMTDLNTAFAGTSANTLTVTAPYMGVASGSRSLTARTMNTVIGQINSMAMCRVDIELECVDSPPEWVSDESS